MGGLLSLEEKVNLHTVMITYNRLELTKQAFASYLETRTGPGSMVIVDNGSTDGTVEWLHGLAKEYADTDNWPTFVLTFPLGENKYPGYACNTGWEQAPPDTVLLHRADNDFVFLPDWETHVRLMFTANPDLGQLGLRTGEEELHNLHNVGGNCVIRKELFDEGLRYDERPWPKIAKKVPGYTEDSFLSPEVRKMGWEWDRVRQPCIKDMAGNIGDGRYDEYLRQTRVDRGIR
jgi:glycosyltransferase involved in cell wall biosynthesis